VGRHDGAPPRLSRGGRGDRAGDCCLAGRRWPAYQGPRRQRRHQDCRRRHRRTGEDGLVPAGRAGRLLLLLLLLLLLAPMLAAVMPVVALGRIGEAEGLAAGGSSPFAAGVGWLAVVKAGSERQATNVRAAMMVPPGRITAG